MAVLHLDFEVEYDFQVIAISSNQKSYTLCWEINRLLQSELKMVDFYAIKSKKVLSEFKKYRSEDETFTFDFICNRAQNQRLVPELRTVDYFIRYYDDESPYSSSELTTALRKSKMIQAVYSLDVESLKSKQVFIFE